MVEGGTKEAGAVPVQTALLRLRTSVRRCRSGTMGGRAYFAGQQAGWLAASRLHTWPLAQQMLVKAAPWLAHE